MMVFSLFIALILERLRITPEAWKLDPIADRWDAWLNEKDDINRWRNHDLFGPLLLVAPAIVLAILMWINYSVLAAVLVNIIVLTLVIGCRTQRSALRQYFLAAKRGDNAEVEIHAEALKYHPDENLNTGQQLVWLNFRFYAAVSIWFILLGAPGALAYGLLRSRADVFPKILAWVEWLPLRICAFGYVLVGHFSKAMPVWLKIVPEGIENPPQQLVDVAVAAEEVPEDPENNWIEAEALVNLVRRNMILILVIVAFATLLGWVV
ncbi:membrane protein required for beta-lactamase induction [Idiomarina sp. A28L]|uniref:regulatory signaling modulator protein AmpE n=1 Tax=Idiomarina sp. A28L TaxID=1036674 RepID=UPI0002138729|nr:regulatory signaling modulator protein AmpE [Idiomarina sp. A28L]EGN74819.1 membrane protein required for beta-lactamase induction [Idiomarina sp. A28L]